MIRINIFILLCLIILQSILQEDLFSKEIIKRDSLQILVIAGQSNAINIHADAKDLTPDLVDSTIRFYYHTGMPPDRDLSFFSTSDNKWTNLCVQSQIPYLAHREHFFGPEITLISELSKLCNNLVVIKCAYAGSDLANDWKRMSEKGNQLYKIMMEQINNACRLLDSSGFKYSFSGFFWIQGERDASNKSNAQAYQQNLKEFIEGVRYDLNSPGLPFIISRLPSKQPYTYLSLVRSAQEEITGIIDRTSWVDTDSLDLDKDSIHFVSSGVLKLGALLASAYLKVLHTISEAKNDNILSDYSLNQNYPNPFNASTNISYIIPETGFVKLTVYDILGREIFILINENQSYGKYKVVFDGTELPNSVYIYTLNAGNFRASKKMVLLK